MSTGSGPGGDKAGARPARPVSHVDQAFRELLKAINDAADNDERIGEPAMALAALITFDRLAAGEIMLALADFVLYQMRLDPDFTPAAIDGFVDAAVRMDLVRHRPLNIVDPRQAPE